MTRREARLWIRRHFAGYIRMQVFCSEDDCSEHQSDAINAVWDDEVARISKRILAGADEGNPIYEKLTG